MSSAFRSGIPSADQERSQKGVLNYSCSVAKQEPQGHFQTLATSNKKLIHKLAVPATAFAFFPNLEKMSDEAKLNPFNRTASEYSWEWNALFHC